MDENVSGAFDEQQWKEEHEGWHQCDYCGSVYAERPRVCCGEVHFTIVTTDTTRKDINAMSDAEFFSWIGAIETEVVNGNLQSAKTPF